MTESVAFDQNIEQGGWPSAFSGGWIFAFYDEISTDIVAALYMNDDNPQGTIVTHPSRPENMFLPEAYISWRQNGECREIFVHPSYRRRGVGSSLCAWARSYAHSKMNLLFKAPETMSDEAKAMFESLCKTYGEPFTFPESGYAPIPYSYWGIRLIQNYEATDWNK